MKYSFMTFSTPGLSLDDVLKKARHLGYDGIEPRVEANHGHGIELSTSPAERKEIRQKFQDSGIANACLATSVRYLDDPEKNADHIEATKRYLELAAETGGARLRVFGGGHGSEEKDVFAARNIPALVDALGQVKEAAAAHAVLICLETHDYWCHPEHVATVMQQVDSPAVGVNWDIMHPVRTSGFTVERSFEILRPWIFHFHMHEGTTNREKLEFLNFGDPRGEYDHDLAIRLLHRDGFDGYMSGEWIGWQDDKEHLERELNAIRKIEEEALAS